MKYILLILLTASAAIADIQHSFRIPIQTDGYGQKTNSAATWTLARDAAASNIHSAAGETLTVYSWCSDLATDSFKVARAYLWTDTIQSQSYIDSIDVAEGNSVRFDSVVLSITGINGVVTGQGCTNQIYAFINDSCNATTLANYVVNESYSLTDFNDLYSSPHTNGGKFLLMDSVDMIGAGPTVVTFALTNRTELDDIECLISMPGGNNYVLAICLASCYDWTNTQPLPQLAYNSKASFYALENTGADPFLTVYWTEVEPVSGTATGWLQSWKNAAKSGWRNVWR